MTQREQIINYINEFGKISCYEAYIELGITQLAARIKELKEQGYKFETEWIQHTNRYGKKKPYKMYRLEEK